jgi:hypothetical protein
MVKIAQFIAILGLMLPCVALGQQCDDRTVFLINGVLTSDDEAQENKDVLKNFYLVTHPNEQFPPDFSYVYNPSAKKLLFGVGGAIDFVEVLEQLTGLGISRLLRMNAGLEVIPDSVSNTLITVMSDVAIYAYNPDTFTLNMMVSTFSDEINAGRKVVVVGHSQGNLWANSVLVLMSGTRGNAIAQVGVAVPDSRLERSVTQHITLTQDLVIAAIPFALPGNVTTHYTISEILARTLGHNFVTAYMDQYTPAPGVILSAIDQSFSLLSPLPTAPSSCESIKFASVSCSVVSTDRWRWQMAGTASSAHQSAVVEAVPNPSYGASGQGSSCSAWTFTAQYFSIQYCAKSPTDPSKTNWSAVWDSPPGTSEVRADLWDGATFPSPLVDLATDRKTGLSCPGTFSY